jgi:hypothetical protein
MIQGADWTTVDEVNDAIDAYGNALIKLKAMQSRADSLLPKGSINVGTIGEYYAFIWLKHQFPDALVTYGNATEKSWDIVVTLNNEKTLYQVKTVSLNSKSLRISRLQKGFDKLIVIILGEDYFPEDAYLLDCDFVFTGIQTFSVPNRGQNGSSIFVSNGTQINFDLFDSIAERF